MKRGKSLVVQTKETAGANMSWTKQDLSNDEVNRMKEQGKIDARPKWAKG